MGARQVRSRRQNFESPSYLGGCSHTIKQANDLAHRCFKERAQLHLSLELAKDSTVSNWPRTAQNDSSESKHP